jgi:hypothetical protein
MGHITQINARKLYEGLVMPRKNAKNKQSIASKGSQAATRLSSEQSSSNTAEYSFEFVETLTTENEKEKEENHEKEKEESEKLETNEKGEPNQEVIESNIKGVVEKIDDEVVEEARVEEEEKEDIQFNWFQSLQQIPFV